MFTYGFHRSIYMATMPNYEEKFELENPQGPANPFVGMTPQGCYLLN